MRSNLNRRLEELAARAHARASAPIWVQMSGPVLRIDEGGRRGDTVTFATVHEAARALEAAIDAHEQATGIIDVEHLADLYEDGDELRQRLRRILTEPVQVQGGAVSAEHWPGTRFGSLKTNQRADIPLLLVASEIFHYFGAAAFRERYRANVMTDDDHKIADALYTVWAWAKISTLDQIQAHVGGQNMREINARIDFDARIEFAGLLWRVARLPDLSEQNAT